MNPLLPTLSNLPPIPVNAMVPLPLALQNSWHLGLFCDPLNLIRASVWLWHLNCTLEPGEVTCECTQRHINQSLANSLAVMDMMTRSSPHPCLPSDQPLLCRFSADICSCWSLCYQWLCHVQKMTFNLMSQLLTFLMPPLLQPFLSLRGGRKCLVRDEPLSLTYSQHFVQCLRECCVHCSLERGFSD